MSAAEGAHKIDFDRNQSGESNMGSNKKSKKREKEREKRKADAKAQKKADAQAEQKKEADAQAEQKANAAKGSGAKKAGPKDGDGDSEGAKKVEQLVVLRDDVDDPNYSWTNEGGSLKKLIDTETPFHARQQGGYADGKLSLTFQQSRRVSAQRVGELIMDMTDPDLLDPDKKVNGEAARDLAYFIEKGGGAVCDAVVNAVQDGSDAKTARLFTTYSAAPGFETVTGWELFWQYTIERGEDVVKEHLRHVWALYSDYVKESSEPLMKPGQRTARRYGGGQDEHAGSGDDEELYGKVPVTLRRAFAKQTATPKKSTRKAVPIAVSNSRHAAMPARGRGHSWSPNDTDADDVSVDSKNKRLDRVDSKNKRRDRSSRSPDRKRRARSPRRSRSRSPRRSRSGSPRRSRSRSRSSSRDHKRSRSRRSRSRRSRSRSDSRSNRRSKGGRRRDG